MQHQQENAMQTDTSETRCARADIYATLRQTGRLDQDGLIRVMRSTGRTELVHYAGAAHRDPVAWHLCAAYLADPTASEAVLKSRALKAAHGWDVNPAQLEVMS